MTSRSLRFSSELDIERLRADRRERFQHGALLVPERDILAAVLELLQRHPRVAWARRMNSGVTRYTDRAGAERFVRYGFVGLSDILGQLRPVKPNPIGALLAVECKRDREQPTPEQEAFLDTVRAAGGVAFVARGVDDVMRGLDAA